MILFANKNTTPFVRQMWEICFGDTDEYTNLHFAKKYKEANTLIYFENHEAVASLQMIPYKIGIHGESVPFYYLSGLCTLPEHRRKGYMDHLIHASSMVMEERRIPLAVLVPAEESLFGYYEKYGFEQVFEKSNEVIPPLKDLIDNSPDLKAAYKVFDSDQNLDFHVQKSFKDFEVIIEESKQEDFPPKYNLAGMAKIINVKHMLKSYAKANPNSDFRIRISDKDVIFGVKNGEAKVSDKKNFDFEVDTRLLCRLVFGYKTDILDKPFRSLFPVHKPIMNLMLE